MRIQLIFLSVFHLLHTKKISRSSDRGQEWCRSGRRKDTSNTSLSLWIGSVVSFSSFRFVHWKNTIDHLYSNRFFVESIYVREVLSTLVGTPSWHKILWFRVRRFRFSLSFSLTQTHTPTGASSENVSLYFFCPFMSGTEPQKLLRFHIWSIQAKCYTLSIQTVMLTLVLPAWKHAALGIVLLAVTVLWLLCLCTNLETVVDPGWSFHVSLCSLVSLQSPKTCTSGSFETLNCPWAGVWPGATIHHLC